MHWDTVKQTLRSDEMQSLLQAFERGDPIDFEPILIYDKASYFQLGALSMGFNRTDLIEQLQQLHKKYAYWGEGRVPKTMGGWFEPHDVTEFGSLFKVYFGLYWFGVSEYMIENHLNQELHALLALKTPEGVPVVDSLHDKSVLLWYACTQGNREGFHMLLPHSNLADDGYRCFIAAVYNNYYDIAQDILDDCVTHNTLPALTAGVELFADERFHNHNEIEDEKVREMRRLIQRAKIESEIAPSSILRARKI